MSAKELRSCFLDKALCEICGADGDSVDLLRQLDRDITAIGHCDVAVRRVATRLNLSMWKLCQ